MPTSPKKKGTDFERRVKERLEKDGYYVTRAAGSFGVFDLVALPTKSEIYTKLIMRGFTKEQAYTVVEVLSDCILGVQCKTNGRITNNEVEKIRETSRIYPIKPLLAWRKKRKIDFKVL